MTDDSGPTASLLLRSMGSATTLYLYAFATLRLWSLFANFCVLPLIGLMFAG